MKILDYEGLTYLIEKIKGLLSKKADTTYVDGKVLTDVPVGAKFTDTIYTHPTSHPYSMITGAPTSLPANGGDSATVNGKTVEVNVPANAKFTDTVYTHPSKHEASDITETSSKRFVSDAEKTTWNAKLETSALTPIETSISDLSDQLGDIISRLEALETVGGE